MPYVPTIPPNFHQERVRRMMLGGDPAPDSDAARLVASYRRALHEHHLDPGAMAGPRILTGPELRQVQHGEHCFLRAAAQFLPRLHDVVRDAGYCVLLTDAHGTTIAYRADPAQRKQFKQAGLSLGSCWSEREEGTCGIAEVLLDQRPITVHKTEHFRAAFTTLTCSAAPIFAPAGELIGVLNVSAVQSPDGRDSQRLVNHLVQQSAHLIEDAFFLTAYSHCWVLLAHRNRHYVEVQPEMLLAFDGHGTLLAANGCASKHLAGLACGAHISTLFEIGGERLFAARAGQDLLSLRLAGGGAWLHARVRAPRKRHTAPHRPALPTTVPAGADLPERQRIVAALASSQWRAPAAAQQLGMSRATLYRRLAQLQIRPPHRQ